MVTAKQESSVTREQGIGRQRTGRAPIRRIKKQKNKWREGSGERGPLPCSPSWGMTPTAAMGTQPTYKAVLVHLFIPTRGSAGAAVAGQGFSLFIFSH